MCGAIGARGTETTLSTDHQQVQCRENCWEHAPSGGRHAALFLRSWLQFSCLVVLFLLSLRPLDVEFMRRLSKVVNIVPVIAKADTLTLEERDFFKKKVSFLFLNVFLSVCLNLQTSLFPRVLSTVAVFNVCGRPNPVVFPSRDCLQYRRSQGASAFYFPLMPFTFYAFYSINKTAAFN